MHMVAGTTAIKSQTNVSLMTQVVDFFLHFLDKHNIKHDYLFFVGEGFRVVKTPFTVYDKHHAYSYVTPY